MEKKRININIPIDLYTMLKTEADKIGTPVTGLINVAIKEYLKTGSVIDMAEMFKGLMDIE